MANRSIMFNEFAPSEVKLLNQALQVTLQLVDEKPTIFYSYGERKDSRPTATEIAHARQILGFALARQAIIYGTDQYITDALRFVASDIENWVNGRDASQYEEDAMREYSDKFGIDASHSTVVRLKHLARSLSPQSEIYMDYPVTTMPSDKYLNSLATALTNLVAPAPLGSLDYNASMGVVVDGVLYNIPRIHPLVSQLLELVKDYQRYLEEAK